MPNGKPHLDGHLQVRWSHWQAGHRRHQAHTQLTPDTIQLLSARAGTMGRMMMGKRCRRTRIRMFASSLSYDSS